MKFSLPINNNWLVNFVQKVYRLAPVSNYNENNLPFVINGKPIRSRKWNIGNILPFIHKQHTVFSSMVFLYLNDKLVTLSSYPVALYFTNQFIFGLKLINFKLFFDWNFFKKPFKAWNMNAHVLCKFYCTCKHTNLL